MRRLIEPSHLDLCCLQKPIIIACGSERVIECFLIASWFNTKVNEVNLPEDNILILFLRGMLRGSFAPERERERDLIPATTMTRPTNIVAVASKASSNLGCYKVWCHLILYIVDCTLVFSCTVITFKVINILSINFVIYTNHVRRMLTVTKLYKSKKWALHWLCSSYTK